MITIKQAPTHVKKLGHELRRFENTESSCEIPFIRGSWQHGLKTAAEIKAVEDYYGFEFSSDKKSEAYNFFIASCSLSLKYLSGLSLGIDG